MMSFKRDLCSTIAGSFRKDERGGVVIAFAGAAMCLLMIAAGGIEMHRRNLAVAQLQNAADSAALAGKQRQVFFASKGDNPIASRAKARQFAKDMFEQSMSRYDKSFSSKSADYTWNLDGSFTVASSQTYSFLFGNLMPASFKKVSVKATADFSRSTPTEVAMVLDTTASMFEKDGRPDTRFTLMREASKKFAQQLFDAAQSAGDPNLVRVSVVPWATTVNIKGEAPAAPDFSAYASGVKPEYGSRQWVTSPIARAVDLSGTSFAPVQWRGCIDGSTESPTTYTDGAPGGLKALQVPQAPIHQAQFSTGPMQTFSETVYTSCAIFNPPVACGVDPGTQGFHRLLEKAVPQIRNAAALFDSGVKTQGGVQTENAQAMCQSCASWNTATTTVTRPVCSTPTSTFTLPYCDYYSENGRQNRYFPSGFACTEKFGGCYDDAAPPPTADKWRNACVADPNEPAAIGKTVEYCAQYLTYGGPYPPDAYTEKQRMAGPNMNCPMPMLGLSGNRKQVIDTLDRLSPVPGGTHADVGLRWGLRTLSKDNSWPTFFGLTKAPSSFGSGAQKVMVLVTDGENEQAVDFKGYWGCSRIEAQVSPGCAGSPTSAELDTYMQGWCQQIRDTYKVQIYAIAVNMSNPAAVGRLTNCVGDPSKVFAVDAADLNAVLTGIASRVMAMRLVN